MSGPLAGVRILEVAGIGPGPFCGMMLADLGAEVVRIDRADRAGESQCYEVLNRGRRSIAIDLKHPEAAAIVLRLVCDADGLIEGFRPGVMERLGLGPDACLAANPRLIFGRITGWGQSGPLALRAGHDINFIGAAGALHHIGTADGPPLPPLNLVGDFGGGGMLLAVGMLAGILHARSTGRGQVVDAAMAEGASLLLCMQHGLAACGQWTSQRGTNFLDGSAPFYSTYVCSDGRYVAVGSVEPQFYRQLLAGLELPEDLLASQWDRPSWPASRARIAARFGSRSRAAWLEVFETTDACVTAVLTMEEATHHPQLAQRHAFVSPGGYPQPAPAPRFSQTPPVAPTPIDVVGSAGKALLGESGFSEAEITRLGAAGVVRFGLMVAEPAQQGMDDGERQPAEQHRQRE